MTGTKNCNSWTIVHFAWIQTYKNKNWNNWTIVHFTVFFQKFSLTSPKVVIIGLLYISLHFPKSLDWLKEKLGYLDNCTFPLIFLGFSLTKTKIDWNKIWDCCTIVHFPLFFKKIRLSETKIGILVLLYIFLHSLFLNGNFNIT